jgi:hypothetical protein
MTIAKKPARKPPIAIAASKKASKFINAAGAAAAGENDLFTITLNVPRKILDRINEAARLEGVNRTAFMISASIERVRSIEAAESKKD